jgi:hypothetical protein
LPILAQTTAGLPTGHALIPNANPGRDRSRKALQIVTVFGLGKR